MSTRETIFKRFLANCIFETNQSVQKVGYVSNVHTSDSVANYSTIREFFDDCGGARFKDGLYNVFDEEIAYKFACSFVRFNRNKPIHSAFSSINTCIILSHDWLGRIYFLTVLNNFVVLEKIYMIDPELMEVYVLDIDFMKFHNFEIVDNGNETLSLDYYFEFTSRNHYKPSKSQCVGYIHPLSLGGYDEINNMEIIDLEVYWEINNQLRVQTMGLRCIVPDGFG